MDVVLYHFTDGNSAFTGVKDVNDLYDDYKDWGIVYSYSYKLQEADNGLCGALITMITIADKFTPAIMNAIHFRQSGDLYMEMKMFRKDETGDKVKLVERGSLLVSGCIFMDASLYYLQGDDPYADKKTDSIVAGKRAGNSAKVFDPEGTGAVSANPLTMSWMLNKMWQKTTIRCFDSSNTMMTTEGSVSVESFRYLDLHK